MAIGMSKWESPDNFIFKQYNEVKSSKQFPSPCFLATFSRSIVFVLDV